MNQNIMLFPAFILYVLYNTSDYLQLSLFIAL